MAPPSVLPLKRRLSPHHSSPAPWIHCHCVGSGCRDQETSRPLRKTQQMARTHNSASAGSSWKDFFKSESKEQSFPHTNQARVCLPPAPQCTAPPRLEVDSTMNLSLGTEQGNRQPPPGGTWRLEKPTVPGDQQFPRTRPPFPLAPADPIPGATWGSSAPDQRGAPGQAQTARLSSRAWRQHRLPPRLRDLA